MLVLKPGVSVMGLCPEILIALMVAEGVFALRGLDCIVTAGSDGEHKPGSFHHKGRAVDLRRWHLRTEEDVEAIVFRLREALGDEYDVVIEPDHFHVEYDPQ